MDSNFCNFLFKMSISVSNLLFSKLVVSNSYKKLSYKIDIYYYDV